MKKKLYISYSTLLLLIITIVCYTTIGFAGVYECKGQDNDIYWGCPNGCNSYDSVHDRCCVSGTQDCAPGWGVLPSWNTSGGTCTTPLCWTGGVTCVGGTRISVNDDSWEVLNCS